MTKEQLIRSDTFEALSRAGFVARGIVYGLIGILAIALALGAGGKATSQQGALETVAAQPLGRVLLVAIAVGLGGYALWRLVRASLGRGPEDAGDNLIDRVAGFGSGVAYAFLCLVAARIVAGADDRGSGNVQHEAAGILGWPAGRVIVGVAGLVLLVVGVYQGYRAVAREFLDDAKVGRMDPRTRRVVTVVGVVGHLARMVVFGLIGVYLLEAAIDYDPHAAVGVGGVLGRLSQQPFGDALLGVVAAGLVAFGIYSITDARYHRL